MGGSDDGIVIKSMAARVHIPDLVLTGWFLGQVNFVTQKHTVLFCFYNSKIVMPFSYFCKIKERLVYVKHIKKSVMHMFQNASLLRDIIINIVKLIIF